MWTMPHGARFGSSCSSLVWLVDAGALSQIDPPWTAEQIVSQITPLAEAAVDGAPSIFRLLGLLEAGRGPAGPADEASSPPSAVFVEVAPATLARWADAWRRSPFGSASVAELAALADFERALRGKAGELADGVLKRHGIAPSSAPPPSPVMVEVRAAMIELSAHGKLERERERIMRGGAVPDIAGYRCAPPLLAAWADWLQPVRDARKDGALWPWALRWAAPIMAVQRVVDAWQQGGRTGRVLWLTRATAA